VAADPLFANESIHDFHLRSTGGRYSNGVFVTDTSHSMAIDSGDPLTAYSLEAVPNGSRVNIGAYGNTVEASMSRKSAWVTALSQNDGPVVRGDSITLQWTYGLLSATNLVTLQYSADNGVTWTTIVSGVAIDAGSYIWNSTGFADSVSARWRVWVEPAGTIVDAVDTNFALRSAARAFYVNDSSITGDVYTVTNGQSAADGLTPSSPMLDIPTLLARYDLEPGDTVYVDSGTYLLTQNLVMVWSDGGDSNLSVRLQGSTNYAQGGSVLDRGTNIVFGRDGIVLRGSGVSVSDFTVRDAYYGLHVQSNHYTLAQRLYLYSNAFPAFISRANSVTLRQSVAWANLLGGIDANASRTVLVENITSVDQPVFHFRTMSNSVQALQNSIFYSTIAASNRTSMVTGNVADVNALFLDYNIYYFAPGSSNNVIYAGFTNLLTWQRANGKDYRSSVTNPVLADVTTGHFHPMSTAGRFVPGLGWVADTETSWAIDRANPYTDFSAEPEPNGGRANIGA